MKVLINTILLAAFTLISACGQTETSPFDVSLGEEQGTPVIYLEAVTDKVQLEDYEVNRGNCKKTRQMPVDFVFGGKLMLAAFSCNVKEISVKTDHGTFTYSF